ncbi:EamA family transporter [Spirochaetia bacterium]|nr:EamA family transporter [Spirochaetia bacterium]
MNRKYSVCIIIAGILWGTMGLFVRQLTPYFSAMQIVSIRSFFSMIIFFIVLLIKNKKLLIIPLKDVWCFIGTGCFSIVLFNYCYFRTIITSSLSLAVILLYTSPIFVILLSRILFKEKITLQKIMAIIIMITGLIFITDIFGSRPALNILGILIGLGAGLGYGLYSIFGRYALAKKYNTLTICFYTFLFAFLGTLPFISIAETFTVIVMDVQTLLLVVSLAVFVSVLPYICYTTGLSRIDTGTASILACIEPVVAALIGTFIYKETLKPAEFLGVVLVILAVITLQIGNRNIKRSKITGATH